jgi:hypothetical protein
MTARLIAASALVLAGTTACGISGGTANVGIWRPTREIDTVVCIEQAPGVCARTVEVGRDVPARSFAGGMFAWFNPGYMHVQGAGGAHRLALNSHYDYLRGRGAFALGGRIGGNIAFSSSHLMFSFPTSVLGYWGTPGFSIYAGGGYTYATDNRYEDEDVVARQALHGLHALVGTRIVLRENRSTRLSVSLEGYRTHFRALTATSATYNIGLHF